MPVFKVNVKWGKEMYRDVEVDTDDKPLVFKAQLYALTGVLPDRQKVMFQGATLKDGDWNGFKIVDKRTILLMGSKEEDILTEPAEKPKFIEDMNESELAAAYDLPGGLANLGNTCYVNATIQCLRAVPEFCEALSTTTFVNELPTNDDSVMKTLTFALKDAYTYLEKGQSVTPIILIELLHILFPRFAEKSGTNDFKQQDANEFLTELLRVLQSTLQPKKCDVKQIKNYKSIIDQYFGGEYSIELKCTESEEVVTTTVEDFVQLSCFISQDVKYMFSGLKLKMQEKITKHSSTLGRDAIYLKTCKIDRLPAFLTVQFVRFCYKEKEAVSAKILKDIKFPIDFDAFELCSSSLQEKLTPMRLKYKEYEDSLVSTKEVNNGDVKSLNSGKNPERKYEPTWFEDDLGSNNSGYYTLKAVLTHKGRTASSGHYVGWVKQPNNVWLKCDDDVITAVTEEDIFKLSGGGDWHCAYVLFYGPRKIETH